VIEGKCHRCQEDTELYICVEPEEGLRHAYLCETCSQLEWDESVTMTFLTKKGMENRSPSTKARDGLKSWLKKKMNPPRSEAEIRDPDDGRLLRRTVNGRVVYDSGDLGGKTARAPIPRNVKMYVWQRDNGRCVECGSKERLEYDHIIPVSKGGSNTARNLQLLCERCNRSKGASI
jgi:hypothetical protein